MAGPTAKLATSPCSADILQVSNISFNYGQQDFFRGIRNVSLSLGTGEILAVVGKSGSGKTTLLKCIFGLEDLESGEVKLNGETVTGPAFNLIAGHSDMKLVSQEYHVLENHTVEENILDRLSGYTQEEKNRRLLKMLKLLELVPLKGARAKHLSAGQKQRVSIARALAEMPRLLLLDEPFSNLDKMLSEKLFAYVSREARRSATSVILVTHLAEEALKYAGSVAIIDAGRLVQSGRVWDVYYHPKSHRLAGLLGDYNVIRKEDLVKSAAKKYGSRVFVRPDRLKTATRENCDLQVTVLNSTYNGKCYEILAQTLNGSALKVYSSRPLPSGKNAHFRIGE